MVFDFMVVGEMLVGDIIRLIQKLSSAYSIFCGPQASVRIFALLIPYEARYDSIFNH